MRSRPDIERLADVARGAVGPDAIRKPRRVNAVLPVAIVTAFVLGFVAGSYF